MARKAAILVKVPHEDTARAAARIREFKNVTEVFSCYGEWDIFVLASFDDLKDLDRLVAKDLYSTEGVAKTYTLLEFETA